MKTKKMPGKRLGNAKRGILVKGKWKAVEIDPSIFAEEAMGEIVCFEELTDYSLVQSKKTATVSKLLQETCGKKKKHKRKASGIDAKDETFEDPLQEDDVEDVDLVERPAKKQKKKNQKQKNSDDSLDNKLEKEKSSEGQTSLEGLSKMTEGKKDPQDVKSKNKKKKKKGKKQQENAKDQNVTKTDTKEDSGGKVIIKSKKNVKNWTNAALSSSAGKNTDVSAWKDLFVPPPVLEALSKLGFSAPTPIQALALPPAIRDRMDILGAAETGSGKTLSFGIPMIHSILEWKKSIHCKKTNAPGISDCATDVESIFLPSGDPKASTSIEKSAISVASKGELSINPAGKITAIAGTSTEDLIGLIDAEMDALDETEEAGASEEDQNEEVEENDNNDVGSEADEQSQEEDVRSEDEAVLQGLDFKMDGQEGQDGEKRPLLGLVLTPTRELAVQVKHHIDAVARFTGIKTAILVGGMAPQKQDRILKRKPEIVIATPGRLWEMIQEKHPHLRNLRQLRCLVIDEADRMVERGHFAELENLLEMLNTSQFNPKRQTFVFSATLTMVHSLPSRLLQKKGKKLEQRSKLELLIERTGIKGKPKVIDLTRKESTVETLTETRIHCEKDEKDFYLYYFLLQYPGRTMVFANSIDCIKRLNSLLTILDCTPLPLHANMHQKQRLKNLERFAERESCVLLTTDVAARGLDIPDVQHVIHYQVPRTSETYVHRSGRTARAAKEGLSLLLIGPDDMMNFKKIYRTLGKDQDLPMFPIHEKCMAAIKERVDVARKIEKIEYHNSREKQHNAWFRQAAEEMDVDLDDDVLLGRGRNEEDERQQQKLLKGLKKHLKHLINQPVFKSHMKTKYPTQMGKLQLPQLPLASETALVTVTNQKQKNKLQKKQKGKI